MKMLQVQFTMIFIIHKTSVSFKITRILKDFLRNIIDFYFFQKIVKYTFFHNI